MPKKEIDYSKVKAFATSILECIGDDESIGENPDLPANEKPAKDTVEFNDTESGANPEPVLDFIGDEFAGDKDEEGKSNKKQEKTKKISLMGSLLASKLKK